MVKHLGWQALKWAVRHSPERLRLAYLEEPLIIPTDMDGIRIVAHSSEEYYMRAKSAAKEPETIRWIDSIPKNGTLYDIGANVGTYSLYAGQRGLTVVAIEPHPPSYASLCHNIRLTALNDFVLPLSVACSFNSGLRSPKYDKWQPGTAFHSGHPFRASLDAIVRTVKRQPTHLKIDVDGQEFGVLAGGIKTLDRVDSVMIELETVNKKSCAAMLNAAGLFAQDAWPTDTPTMYNYLFSR